MKLIIRPRNDSSSMKKDFLMKTRKSFFEFSRFEEKFLKIFHIEFEEYLWFFIQRSFTKYRTTNNPIGIQTAHAIPAAVPGDILPLN